MKKYLLPEVGNYYKANLHCHSTISDGDYSPEAIKAAYMEHGYSVIAYTDHNALISHNDLTDDKFLALNGMEIDINEDKTLPEIVRGDRVRKTCHICFIALDKDNLTQPCYHRTKYLSQHQTEIGLQDKIVFDESKPDHVRSYSVSDISAVMKEARDCGFFVTYNHPVWSCETYEQYAYYEGMHAMEICNYACMSEGYDDYNPKEYDDILRTGKRIFCISTDDNHDIQTIGGFTMIKADKLEYKTITDALMAGNFYASQGPAINELYFDTDNGEIHVSCSAARMITMSTGRRRSLVKNAQNGESLTKATFSVSPNDKYVRITVEDERGRHANTNAYFTDELFKE